LPAAVVAGSSRSAVDPGRRDVRCAGLDDGPRILTDGVWWPVRRHEVEALTRILQVSAQEVTWARDHRLGDGHDPPAPAAGDHVGCRLEEWGPVWPAVVERVQPLDDVDDPYLWT